MGRSWIVIVVVLVVLSFSPGSGLGRAVTPTAEAPASALVANATFVNWTWTGSPCTPGSVAVFTAHFHGNASGGISPYQYNWNFGDGSPESALQNPSHVFSHGFEWNVTLNVTDAVESRASAILTVGIPIFNCPAELVSPYPTAAILVGLIIALVAGATAVAVVSGRTNRRRGGNPP
jgi:heme/copper-type cytochrome/quinol oxidase subunit 2